MAGDCCNNACCNCMWKYYSPFVRTCGVLVAAALWAIGITQVAGHLFFIYILFAAFFVSCLELLVFINPCCDRCCSREGRCFVFWEYMSWLDNWKRALVYLLLSVFCYIKYKIALAIVSGALLDALAIIYIIRTYRLRPEDEELGDRPPAAPKSTSSSKSTASAGTARTYGRFENNDAVPATVSSQSEKGVKSSRKSKKAEKYEEKERQRLEDEMRYPGGNVPNPFEGEGVEGSDKEGRERMDNDDDDVVPEGDAGLMRYPP